MNEIIRMKAESDYCYPGTDVLVNKRGLRSRDELEFHEGVFSEGQMGCILSQERIELDGFGHGTLSRIHECLFRKVYSWAGELRTEDFAKGGTRFRAVEDIPEALDEIEEYIESINRLEGLGLGEFTHQMAAIHNALNQVHPFREGNGRTMRTFLTLLANYSGHDIDYGAFPAKGQDRADAIGAITGEADYIAHAYASMMIDKGSETDLPVVRIGKAGGPLITDKGRLDRARFPMHFKERGGR